MSESLKEQLELIFRDIRPTDAGDGRLVINAEPAQVLAVLRFLKDRGFDYMVLLSAVDRIEAGQLELVYILTKYDEGYAAGGATASGGEQAAGERQAAEVPGLRGGASEKTVLVKTAIPRDAPRFSTAIGIFPNAEPYEREIHELFGIHFEGHPRLTPLFLEREYPIPPFRKDFDTREYVKDVFDAIPSVEEEDE